MAEVEVDFGGCLSTNSCCQRGGGFRFLDFCWPTRRRLRPSLSKWQTRKRRWKEFHHDLSSSKLRRRRSRSRWRRRRRRQCTSGQELRLAVKPFPRRGAPKLRRQSQLPNHFHNAQVLLPSPISPPPSAHTTPRQSPTSPIHSISHLPTPCPSSFLHLAAA